ncbi:hypothetical protein WA538_004327, partial [Blastocystis sp. DL]
MDVFSEIEQSSLNSYCALLERKLHDSEEHHRQLTERVLELEGQLDSVLLHMSNGTEVEKDTLTRQLNQCLSERQALIDRLHSIQRTYATSQDLILDLHNRLQTDSREKSRLQALPDASLQQRMEYIAKRMESKHS